MRIITFLFTFLLLVACKDSSKPIEHKNKSSKSTSNLNNTSNVSSSKSKENIIWNTVKVKNFTFSLPSNFHLEKNLSNNNKKVYTSTDETLGLTIDIANLPNGYESSVISEMIPNLNDFGNSINQDNKKHFDDFRLLNTKHSSIGNNESIEVTQMSTKVSGKNISMIVATHFIIANPYYCSITFSYPRNSFQGEQTIEKIKNSFKFNLPKSTITQNKKVSQRKNEPTLKESQKWVVSKLNKYIVQEVSYSDGRYGPVNKSVTTFTNVRVEDNTLIFKYNFKLYEPFVDEKTLRGYDNAGISRDMALRMSKDKKLTRDENRIIKVPFKSISSTYYDEDKNYKGECDFSISTSNNDITETNLTKGTINYTSYFSFTYDCSQEDDLGNRINEAIQYIISLTPNDKKTNNEPF